MCVVKVCKGQHHLLKFYTKRLSGDLVQHYLQHEEFPITIEI